jgi:uncharacterized membrane protein
VSEIAAQKRALIEATQPADEAPDLPEIVSRYMAGESMQVLAKECGTYRKKLYRWMLSELGGEKYREVVTECLITRIADADALLEDAKDAVEIARAREIARFARMDFERRRPTLYGVKQEVRHTIEPRLTIIAEEPKVIGSGSAADVSDAEVVQ